MPDATIQSLHGADPGWPLNKIMKAISAAGGTAGRNQPTDDGGQSLLTWCPGPSHKLKSEGGGADALKITEHRDGSVRLFCFKRDDTREILEFFGLTREDLQRAPDGTLLTGDRGPLLPPPSAPMAVARAILAARWQATDERPTLAHWRGAFYLWTGSHWLEQPDAAIRAELYRHLEYARYAHDEEERPWAPNRTRVSGVVEALQAITRLDDRVEDRTRIEPRHATTREKFNVGPALIPVRDGLLDPATRLICPASPDFFNLSALPVDTATLRAVLQVQGRAAPPQWLAFLDSLWPDDAESIALLQEYFGLVVSGETRYHKLLPIIGPPRSGKGTIGRTLTALVGADNVCSPTLASLGQNFGLSSMIGRTLAIIGDARTSRRVGSQAVERLLTITGEDLIDVDRKNRPIWTGRLRVRFLLLSNELPTLPDASGALASRMLGPLELGRSWLGQEDLTLEERLSTELDSILAWALDGWDRLRERGRFTLPKASADAARALLDLSSPVQAFLRDRGVVEPAAEVLVNDVFSAWREWCEENAIERAGTVQQFSKDLRAAVPGLRTRQHRVGKGEPRFFTGVRLAAPTDPDPEPEPDADPEPEPDPEQDPAAETSSPQEPVDLRSNARVSARVTHDAETVEPATLPGMPPRAVVDDEHLERFTAEPLLVSSEADLVAVLPKILAAEAVGLDVESTGLDPFTDSVRLVQLATEPAWAYVVDCAKVPARALQPVLDKARLLVGHHLKFDLRMLRAAGLTLPSDLGRRLFDTMLASQVLDASDHRRPNGWHGLGAVVERHLGIGLDKSMQTSDWSGELSESQLAYAAADAAVLLPLRAALEQDIKKYFLTRTVRAENWALPAMVWLEDSGIHFDLGRLDGLVDHATKELETARRALGDAAGRLLNWDSPKQVLALLREQGNEITNTSEATLKRITASSRTARAMLDYRDARTRLKLFGADFAKHVHPATGRIHADFLQLGSRAGRMSCTRPNLQQVPHSQAYRECFRALPDRVLIKADYSQIELRIATDITEDSKLVEAYRAGEDLHRLTAQRVLGKREVTKADRQAAKALNFGLLYGMGAERLRQHAAQNYGVELSEAQATEYRNRFFETYAGLRKWHRQQPKGEVVTRTALGRRRLGVTKFTEKVNTPVQGTGADGLKLALGYLFRRREQMPEAFPVLVVHDEIVIECPADKAEAAAAWLRDAMVDGMQKVVTEVPIVVETVIAESWAGEAP